MLLLFLWLNCLLWLDLHLLFAVFLSNNFVLGAVAGLQGQIASNPQCNHHNNSNEALPIAAIPLITLLCVSPADMDDAVDIDHLNAFSFRHLLGLILLPQLNALFHHKSTL